MKHFVSFIVVPKNYLGAILQQQYSLIPVCDTSTTNTVESFTWVYVHVTNSLTHKGQLGRTLCTAEHWSHADSRCLKYYARMRIFLTSCIHSFNCGLNCYLLTTLIPIPERDTTLEFSCQSVIYTSRIVAYCTCTVNFELSLESRSTLVTS